MVKCLIDKEIEAKVQAYIDGVLSGDIVACRYVRLAVERHLKDLETCKERGLVFDGSAAQIAIDFFGFLRHSKGKWAGQKFELSDWQLFIIWVLFGWKKADGSRRFRVAYNEVARKNGKSTFAAGIGLYLLLMDNEPGAEVYSAATKMDQAKIIHQEAIRMVRQSPYLRKRAGIYVNNIHVNETSSKFEPLGADAKTLDGLNPNGATIDELHAHPDSTIWDVIRSAFGSRRQPLLFAITTAGFNMQSFCHLQREYAIKVLEGFDDDSFFAIIFTLDYDKNGKLLDDWKDESCWIKSNPNLGISVDIEDMRNMCKEAVESPSKLNNFLCKKLNIWTTQKVKWLNVDKWNECNLVITEDFLIGKECYGALDLSSNTDISCWGLLFPWEDEQYIFIPRFYIPKDNAHRREHDDRVPYVAWSKEGYITLTEGNVIDYSVIQADIFKDCEKFDIKLIAFDRWNFEAVRQRLIAEGIPEKIMIGFGQGFASMSAPMKELERMYLAGQLIYNNNPVLTWMAGNVSAKTDPADNIKPDKEKSFERIDGIVTLIMALGIAITKVKPKSIYEDRGVLVI